MLDEIAISRRGECAFNDKAKVAFDMGYKVIGLIVLIIQLNLFLVLLRR